MQNKDLSGSVAERAKYVPDVEGQDIAEELADARLLHRLSVELIQEDGIAGLYSKIVEAAVAIMRSQFATLQMLYPVPGTVGKLRILACSNLSPDAAKYFEWVYPDTGSSCGEVLRTGRRVIVPDYRTCTWMKGAPTLPVFLEGGIIAAQSTPLYSRTGKLLGMISTHWGQPYTPPQRHLNLIDILARQAADLIERTQTAVALQESEARLRALSNATSNAVFRMSPDWSQMDQLKGSGFLENTDEADANWLEKYILADDQACVMTTVAGAVAERAVFELEHRVVKADGSTGWALTRAVPIADADGVLLEWFGAASDITDKKLMVTRLEDMVQARTKELLRSNEDLQQFAHVTSHDLKEPVRKIQTFGDLLQKELGSQSSGLATMYMTKILESARRMSTMVEGVLRYSSLNALAGEAQLVDLNKLFADIRNDLELAIEEKGAVITCDPLPEISGIEVLLYQLFYNLTNNALKFSKPGEKPRIRITAERSLSDRKAYWRLAVGDDGIGFEPAYNDKIFDSFARLNPKTTYDGTGLGLTLARKIAERHGGRISAAGVLGEGAVFTVSLPA